MAKNGKLSRHKRRRLQIFPGDIPFNKKIEMLENPNEFEDVTYVFNPETNISTSQSVPQPNRAKGYKRDFVKGANRKFRHSKIEIEE